MFTRSSPRRFCIFFVLASVLIAVVAEAREFTALPDEKPRIVVLTDMSNEPDDEESLVRFLVYSNEYDIEGLIATTSTWLRQGTREDLIRRQIAAYAQVRDRLARHAPGFPAADALAAVTASGQPGYGMEHVGENRSTPGSRQILAALQREDPRPLWISVWGGANTLAQALSELRRNHSPEQTASAISRLRVYSISDQDDAGAWIRREFPELFYIVSPTTQDEKEYWRTTWSGISGDRFYRNGPEHRFDLVENSWLEENIIQNHGQLGALYPRWAYIMEGDTPSFLGLIRNGLGWSHSPAFGGWGGRYVLYRANGETRPIWTNNATSRDTVTAHNGITDTSDSATVWRWREHFQNDFAARMDWCVAGSMDAANHNPVLTLNNDTSRAVLTTKARGGEQITLSADGSRDPDDDTLQLSWWIYPEAGSISGATLSNESGPQCTVHLPRVDKPGTLHVILQAADNGTPQLFAYRRLVIEVTP